MVPDTQGQLLPGKTVTDVEDALPYRYVQWTLSTMLMVMMMILMMGMKVIKIISHTGVYIGNVSGADGHIFCDQPCLLGQQ